MEQTLYDKFQKLSRRKATEFAWTKLPDPDVRRQMKKLITQGRFSLHDDQFNEVKEKKFMRDQRSLQTTILADSCKK